MIFKGILCQSVAIIALTLSGCSDDRQTTVASSQLQGATYTCEAMYPITRGTEIKSGSTQAEACALALDECNLKKAPDGSATCVIKRWYDQTTTAEGMTSGQGWACKVQENTGMGGDRSWVRPGATLGQARSNAMEYCETRKAGINCQIISCFDASNQLP